MNLNEMDVLFTVRVQKCILPLQHSSSELVLIIWFGATLDKQHLVPISQGLPWHTVDAVHSSLSLPAALTLSGPGFPVKRLHG